MNPAALVIEARPIFPAPRDARVSDFSFNGNRLDMGLRKGLRGNPGVTGWRKRRDNGANEGYDAVGVDRVVRGHIQDAMLRCQGP